MTDETMSAGGYGVNTNRPSIWYHLGFRYRFDEDLFNWRNKEPPDDGFVGCISTMVTIHISFVDRLRLLVSGKAELNVYTKTNVTVDHAVSRSQFAVLPP